MSTYKIQRKISSLFLFTIISIALCAVILLCNNNKIDAASVVPIYIDKETRSHFTFEEDFAVGVQFNATASFNKFGIKCPSYSNNIGSLTLSLHKWDTDYDTTIASAPLAEKKYVDFKDNQELVLSFDYLPAGEYLFLIHSPEEKVGIWTVDYPISGSIRTLCNGVPMNFTPLLWINFEEKKSDPKDYFDFISFIDTDHLLTTPPPESIPGTDSPIIQKGVNPDSWAAVDGLGRTLPTYEDVGEKTDKERYVGIFYWTWHYPYAATVPVNLQKVWEEYPQASNDYYHSIWRELYSKAGVTYFWNEPIFGHYTNTDEYVIRKHAELLADAGVDVIVFDATNGTGIFKTGYETVFKVFSEARKEGVNTPKIMFMFNLAPNSYTETELYLVYQDIYSKGRYQDLWFYWEGKPMIMAHEASLDEYTELNDCIKDFFTFRGSDLFFFSDDTQYEDNVWGWLSAYPQTKYGVREDGSVEQMTVGIAQNASEHGLVAMNDYRGGVFGRSYAKGDYSYTYTYKNQQIVVDKNIENVGFYGLNFQQQWDYAIEVDPDFIFVTGWNEWTVGRHEEWQGTENAFPDQWRDEYSRDIEPTKGDLKDYYYYQLVANIRRYKGVSKPSTHQLVKTIDITSSQDQWADVTNVYTAYSGSTRTRDIESFNNTYTNKGLRNDIVLSKVTYDSQNIYFMVETVDDITPYTDPAWMRLLIDTDPTGISDNWEGFEFIINRVSPSATEAVLERSTGGWNFTEVGKVRYTVKGNRLQIEIPRAMLGFEGDNLPEFNFKWSDFMQVEGDITDFYVNGDVAPGGRFTYVFSASKMQLKKSFWSNYIWIILGIALVLCAGGVALILVFKRKKK